jgi:hypothetical protein
MKVLGAGELSTALFVVADAFSASARSKIEGAGGTVSVLEVPDGKRPALGVTDDTHADETASAEADASAEPEESTEAEGSSDGPAEPTAKPARGRRGAAAAESSASELTPDEAAAVEAALGEADATAGEPAAEDEAPAKPRATRKPKTPKPDTDA